MHGNKKSLMHDYKKSVLRMFKYDSQCFVRKI